MYIPRPQIQNHIGPKSVCRFFGRQKVLPLLDFLRSNLFNPHADPISAGIPQFGSVRVRKIQGFTVASVPPFIVLNLLFCSVPRFSVPQFLFDSDHLIVSGVLARPGMEGMRVGG